MIDYYKKQAQIKWLMDENRKNDEVRNWIEIIERINLKQKSSIQDIIPRVLKYISFYEKRCEHSDINLSSIYMFLSEVSNGKPYKELSERTGYFLYQCLVRLAENLQKQDFEESKMYLRSLQNAEKIIKKLDDSMINPLHVPKDYLETSPIDFSDDA